MTTWDKRKGVFDALSDFFEYVYPKRFPTFPNVKLYFVAKALMDIHECSE